MLSGIVNETAIEEMRVGVVLHEYGAAGGWIGLPIAIAVRDVPGEKAVIDQQIHIRRAVNANDINGAADIAGLVISKAAVRKMNRRSVAMNGAAGVEVRMTRQVCPVSEKARVTNVNPGEVSTESAGIILRRIVVPDAPLETNGRSIHPECASARAARIGGIILENALDKTRLAIGDTDRAAVVFLGRKSIRESETLEAYKLRCREGEDARVAVACENDGSAGGGADGETARAAVQVGINRPTARWGGGISAGCQFNDPAIGDSVERLLQAGGAIDLEDDLRLGRERNGAESGEQTSEENLWKS